MSENDRQRNREKINERVGKEIPNKCRERESNEKMKDSDGKERE